MGKKRYWNSEAKNARWIKEGRGKGTGKDYKPWLTVRDVPSEGRSHRLFGHLTHRTHHLLSDLELATFLLVQWRDLTTDIREQFPLDLAITQRLCNEAGVRHPIQNGVPQFMSSDFLVSTSDKSNPQFVLQVKASSALEDPRTIEKLEIERRYWWEKEVPWYLVTEKDIPRVVFTNIDWFYSLQAPDFSLEDESRFFEFYSVHLKQNPRLTIIDLCKQLDAAYSLELGESLYQLRSLLARRYFHFDITIPFNKLRCNDMIYESLDVVVELQNVSGK
ncbi:heteromeric transposase endonuclease subunit TnsA [Hahella sp. KA22]|uniref:TnsA endonuclease C-terminal domain-containing protein n=1 Tax=Hahella sp. KA22 TaxID=1628392 RepID=UPI000FDD9C71|nr:TnsA endonuclease C-terminal domain-containing protein [Hahella sp. KA22]AZZ95349.1 heteromeric transposase endonuclease subunit TnsA [Hahella sp. KA22]QAY52994.1 heteromeric transposase endonuclease subunit TnsA [Hahella sp. KA22]